MRRIRSLLVLLAVILGLSGCMALNSADLLTLPEISPDHRELLKLINAATASSAWTTTNPVAGSNKLTTQFVDIYQDGIPEALAFFRNPADFKLRLTIYTKTGKSTYGELCTIEMAGEQFHRIDFVDVNGDGNREFIVGIRHATSAMYGLNVFTLKNSEGVLLADATYTDLALYDLTGDTVTDIVTINSDAGGINAHAELFGRTENGFGSLGTAPLSASVHAPSAVVCGNLNESMQAMIVEGSFTDAAGAQRYLSDILLCRDGVFTNLSYAEIYHQSFETQCSVALQFSDVNFDGFLEFPIAFTMPYPQTVTNPGGVCVRWFGYAATGEVKAVIDTYHASDNRWFFQLPQSWNDRVYVRSETGDGYRAGVFATDVDGHPRTLMTLYMFSSAAALQKSEIKDLIVLKPYNDIYYAATVTDIDDLPVEIPEMALSREEIASRLVFVLSDGTYRRMSDLK